MEIKTGIIWICVFMMAALPVMAYCNETITYSSNANANATDYNITKTCSADEARSDSTAGLAVVVFILAISLGFFGLGFSNKKYTKNMLTDFIIKRSFMTIAIWMTVMNLAVVATISKTANLGVEPEIFRYLWIFGWIGWAAAWWLVIGTLFKIPEMWKKQNDATMFGIDEEEDK